MKFLLIAAALAASIVTPAMAGEPHPQTLKFLSQFRGTEYFECSYTNKTCERGIYWGSNGMYTTRHRLFELIDDTDRKTILAHGYCYTEYHYGASWICFDLDHGTYNQETSDGRKSSGDMHPDKYGWRQHG